MKKLFGTDGVRGVANRELTVELAVGLGRAAARFFGAAPAAPAAGQPLLLVGRDPRVSGGMLAGALTAGFCSAGGRVLDAGIIPTPAVALLVRAHGASAGAVISASHNPMTDNGIKFFDADGHKLSDAQEEAIEGLLAAGAGELPDGTGVGAVAELAGAADEYRALVRATLPPETSFAGLKVVVDGANGAASAITPRLLRELGAEVTAINCAPDGYNINRDCGSLHLRALGAAVVEARAQVGLAHDGDADRVLFADETGTPVDGDQLLALCALHLRDRGELPGNTVVATVMSNLGFEKFLTAQGITVLRTAVGDRYVLEAMRAGGYALGGEQSGHLIFYAHNHTGDGVITALQVLQIFNRRPGSFSDLTRLFPVYPQKLVNVKVRVKRPFAELPRVAQRQRELEAELRGTGRILLRYSGTEPLARVMVEAATNEAVEKATGELAALVAAELG